MSKKEEKQEELQEEMEAVDAAGVSEVEVEATEIENLKAELSEMEGIRYQLGTNFCRRCNYCAPCTVGISIPNAFLFAGYLERYNLADWARDRYGSLGVKASACVGCGKCETRCPYHLPIREMLKKVAEEFGE